MDGCLGGVAAPVSVWPSGSPNGINISHRPSQPSLNNGPVQRRVRRAFVVTGQSVLSTLIFLSLAAEVQRDTVPKGRCCAELLSPKRLRSARVGFHASQHREANHPSRPCRRACYASSSVTLRCRNSLRLQAADDDKRRLEAVHDEVTAQLLGIPARVSPLQVALRLAGGQHQLAQVFGIISQPMFISVGLGP